MGYIEENLLSGEQIIYETRTHKLIFLWPVLWVIAGTAMILGGLAETALFVFGAGVIHLIFLLIKYFTTEYGLTNQRVIVKAGWIQRETQELFLRKIESIQVNQSVLGRILNFGTISLSGTGGQSDQIPMIPAPLEFKKRVQEQLRDQ